MNSSFIILKGEGPLCSGPTLWSIVPAPPDNTMALHMAVAQTQKHKKFKGVKGTHEREFRSLFIIFFLLISITNRYKTQYSKHFWKYSWNSPRYLKFSITPRFRWKHKAWLNIVAKNAGLNLALSSYCAFLERFEHFRRKSRVKLNVFGESAELN